MEEEDNIIVKWAQEYVETLYSLLNSNNSNNSNKFSMRCYGASSFSASIWFIVFLYLWCFISALEFGYKVTRVSDSG